METSVNLDSDQFESFLKCLSNLKDSCTDLDLRNGVIRQRSTDKSIAFEMDLTSLVDSGINISLIDIRTKLDMLKVFSGQEVEIKLDHGETESSPGILTFSDQYSSLKINCPNSEFLDNKFINEEQFTHVYELSDEDLVMECEVSKMISDRIKIITQALHIPSIQIIFNGDTASIMASAQSKDQHAKFLQDIITNISLENSFANLSLIPFTIEHDSEMSLKMFANDERNITMNSFKTSLGDIDINMYSRASIVSLEE